MAKKVSFFNNFLVGLIAGLIAPLIGVYLFYLSQHTDYDFNQFISLVMAYSFAGQVLSVGTLANLAVFFIFLALNYNKSAKGVILATFIYALITLTIKYFV